MGQILNIQIANKIAKYISGAPIVCGNAGYKIKFDFDAEWDNHDIKTLKINIGDKSLPPVPFSGTECELPIIENTLIIEVGVFAGLVDDGTLSTTTPALVECLASIRDRGKTEIEPPSDDVYNRMVDMVEKALTDAETAKDHATIATDAADAARESALIAERSASEAESMTAKIAEDMADLGRELDEQKESLDELVDELSYDAEKWGEVFKEVSSENYITSGEIEWTYGYLVASTGKAANTIDENWRQTAGFIPVSEGDIITIKKSIIGHPSVAMIACYDAKEGYLPAYTSALVKGDYVYTIPKGVAYIRLSFGNRLSPDVAPTFDTQEVYHTTYGVIETPKDNIDNLYKEVNTLKDTVSVITTATPLVGKVVFLAGDSRSSTDYTFYKELLEGKCGCTALVQGASGRNVAYNASNTYFTRLENNPHDFSIWIVGGNDAGSAGSIGTFSADSVNGKNGEEVVTETDISVDYNGTKFVQAIDHMMRKYKAMFYNFKELGNRHFPKMIFCTDLPQQRNSASSAYSLKENWERKNNAIIECAKKNNVALLDLYSLCNFDMSFEPFWVSPTDKVNDNGLYFMDGLHPNQYGIDVITSLEIEEMKKYVMVTDYIKPRRLVDNGLIMYCDGINNTGGGHSDTATTWKDLSGNGNDIINVAATTSTTPASTVQGEWLDNGIRVITASNQFLRTVNTFDLGADRTMELRVTLNANNNMCVGLKGADRVKFRSGNSTFWVRLAGIDSGGDTKDMSTSRSTQYNAPIAVTVTRAYDAANGRTRYIAYVNGTSAGALNVDGDYRAGESAYFLCGMESDDITVHTVRMYNRVLTADEVKNNYFYDADRMV